MARRHSTSSHHQRGQYMIPQQRRSPNTSNPNRGHRRHTRFRRTITTSRLFFVRHLQRSQMFRQSRRHQIDTRNGRHRRRRQRIVGRRASHTSHRSHSFTRLSRPSRHILNRFLTRLPNRHQRRGGQRSGRRHTRVSPSQAIAISNRFMRGNRSRQLLRSIIIRHPGKLYRRGQRRAPNTGRTRL